MNPFLILPFLGETGENVRFLSLQQAPVGGDLHFQVLLDAEELLVVGLDALHVQPELGQVVLELAQGGLQPLHLSRVFLTRLTQVTFQRCYLRRERENDKRDDLPYPHTPVSYYHCMLFIFGKHLPMCTEFIMQ